MLPPDTCTWFAAGELTVAPTQVVVGLALAGTVTPAGKVSSTLSAVKAWLVGFKKVIRRRERSPALITFGVNCLVIPTLAFVVKLVLAWPPDINLSK